MSCGGGGSGECLKQKNFPISTFDITRTLRFLSALSLCTSLSLRLMRSSFAYYRIGNGDWLTHLPLRIGIIIIIISNSWNALGEVETNIYFSIVETLKRRKLFVTFMSSAQKRNVIVRFT